MADRRPAGEREFNPLMMLLTYWSSGGRTGAAAPQQETHPLGSAQQSAELTNVENERLRA
jgi:hypothetical protein